jgi:LPS-assembly protein
MAQSAPPADKMLVEAREVEFDRDNDRVSAIGEVKLYYQGRVLEADRVTYSRRDRRVIAIGNAQLTEQDGTKTYGNRFDLTEDFRDGFVESLRLVGTENQRISAERAERSGGETSVFDRTSYTPCKPCAEAPERPPLWQVRAARVIHNKSERTMYFENAALEFFGVPVVWVPFFSAPDPTVKRKSGVLAPKYLYSSDVGRTLAVPLYWAAADNYDVTFTPIYFSRQGFMGDLYFRHRLDHGSYTVRANGIEQRDPEAFPIEPYAGAGAKDFRGSVASQGNFFLNEQWQLGWNGYAATDKFYADDYKIRTPSYRFAISQEIESSVYLRGRGEPEGHQCSLHHIPGLLWIGEHCGDGS